MLFNSQEFIFLFLPFVCCLIYATQSYQRLAQITLLILSLVFYGYYNINNLPIIINSILFNYALGFYIYNNKPLLIFGVAINLLIIAYFKYMGFFIHNINFAFGSNISSEKLVLPLAISFFTFCQITYLVDVYKAGQKETKFVTYALFVTFFPHLIAGPIVHYKSLIPQFQNIKINIEHLAVGLTIFILGLFKKVIIADNLAPYANMAFDTAAAGATLNFIESWLGALAYSFQLYFDFSGYSDMAIGLAKMFGIILPINFNSPYKATSIIDFWRRWHITLSNFLRDYLYIPLGGNKYGVTKKYINLFITMLLGGLWHGANWTFVIWGAMHGIYLIINHLYRNNICANYKSPVNFKIPYFLITQFFVVLAWVVFRSDNISVAVEYLKSMLVLNSFFISVVDLSNWTGLYTLLFIAAATSCLLPNTIEYLNKYLELPNVNKSPSLIKTYWRPTVINALILAFMMTMIIIATLTSGKMEFLYFDF